MYRNFQKIKNDGLTLVELMVVVSIFMIITLVAIFNYSNFNNSVSLQNLTDDIAISIRKAQSFAIGARDVGDGTKEFDKSYGMHFSVNKNPSGSLSGSNRSFLMFSIPITNALSDKKYTDTSNINSVCGVSNNCVEFFDILSIDEIEKIEAFNGLVKESADGIDSSVDIVFTRPDPRASICYRENINSDCISNISSVNIVISNGQEVPEKRIKTISVQNTGQISIQ